MLFEQTKLVKVLKEVSKKYVREDEQANWLYLFHGFLNERLICSKKKQIVFIMLEVL